MVLLAQCVGASFLGGFAAMFLMLLGCIKAITFSTKFKRIQLTLADGRIKLTNELLAGVRVVKAYGWEAAFRKEVMVIRTKETYQMKLQALVLSFLVVVILTSPVILAIVTFSIYVGTGNVLQASTVFTALALLNLIRFPLAFLPFGLAELVKINVSMGRMQVMLSAAENDRNDAGGAAPGPVSIIDAEFGYPLPVEKNKGKGKGKSKGGCLGCLGKLMPSKGKGKGKGKDAEAKPEEPIDARLLVEVKRGDQILKFKRALKVPKFEPAPGGLTMIVGSVGAGKSSLLSALLGDAEQLCAGNTFGGYKGRVAYASQVPWIINTTFEQNIRYACTDQSDSDWYEEVLESCCLVDDLSLLPAGDQTEIGERGINLSGGQRARISVARAVYRKDVELCLFDDPLAAIDAHVGKKLFDQVFSRSGVLAGKTRVLVTHQVQYLKEADRVVIIEDGVIVAMGTYEELAAGEALKGLGLDEVGLHARQTEEQVMAIKSSRTSLRANLRTTRTSIQGQQKEGTLVQAESTNEGAVKWSTFKLFASTGFGPCVVSVILLCMLSKVVATVFTDLWLAYWTEKGDPLGLETMYCVLIYMALGVLQGITTYCRSYTVFALGIVRAGRKLYDLMFFSVFGSPVVFFDTTPSGRLLNRFSADMDVLDNQFPRLLGQTIGCLESFCAILVGIIVINPAIIVAILPVSIGYIIVVNHYRYASRDAQRLVAVTTTPIFNRISESLAGLPTVRAFGYEEFLRVKSYEEINNNQACNLLKVQLSAWLSLRLELLSMIVTTACALLPILPGISFQNTQAAFVGVTLTYSLDMSKYVQAIAKSVSDLEQKFTSVERILDYCNLPQEAAYELPSDANLGKNWPSGGAIEYRNVTMRYRPELDPALRGLTFAVGAGEKLGVVGRTGSGKSSIIVTLLRLTEVESGTVFIDGQDLKQVGLHSLRTKLAMIPQEPVLFGKTTLRRNLDPFEEHSDKAIMDALGRVQMDSKETLPDGLTTEIEEGGAPFSVGQRQLLCLARAVLRSSKIILLDEATASVDNETDALIQRTIREMFKASTVVCIAHRIRTILDSDKILVMGAGVCKELGPPQELLATKDSEFRKLAIESNIPVPDLN